MNATSNPGSDPDPDPPTDGDDGEDENEDVDTLPVIRSFVPVPELCYESPGGMTIHDPSTPRGWHWIESDDFVHLDAAR